MVKDRNFYLTMLKIAIPIALQSFLSFLVVIAEILWFRLRHRVIGRQLWPR